MLLVLARVAGTHAIRPLTRDGHFGIFFVSRNDAKIDMTAANNLSVFSPQVSACPG